MQAPTVAARDGNYKHVKWIDLQNNGVMTECAVLKTDTFGNMYFITIPNLDGIDKTRLVRILTNQNATHFELWDLMSQITLNNGVNALTYFHQLVKVITPQGVIMNPRQGTVGTGHMQAGTQIAPAPGTQMQTVVAPEAAPETAQKRGPGRPPKNPA